MSGLCARCHFNIPFAPGEDFCIDCATEVEAELEAVLAKRGAAPPGGLMAPSPAAPRSVSADYWRMEFHCTPCECGGVGCPECE